MVRKHKHYSREFKMDAIHLAETSGKTIVKIEQDLGLSRGLLNRWKNDNGRLRDINNRFN